MDTREMLQVEAEKLLRRTAEAAARNAPEAEQEALVAEAVALQERSERLVRDGAVSAAKMRAPLKNLSLDTLSVLLDSALLLEQQRALYTVDEITSEVMRREVAK